MLAYVLLFGILFLTFYWWQQKVQKFKTNQHGHYLGHSIWNLLAQTLKKISSVASLVEDYNQVKKNGKKFGIILETNPNIFICDADLAKFVMIKYFDHLHDRRTFIDTELRNEKYLTKLLVMFTGQKWRNTRNVLSPAFTTRHLKGMFQIMGSSSKLMVEFIENEIKEEFDSTIDVRIGIEKYTLDVIAKLAFGFDPKTFATKTQTMFERQARNLDFNTGNPLYLMTIVMLPWFANLLGLSFFKPEVQRFFGQTVEVEVKRRKESGEKGTDFLQFFIEAKNKDDSKTAFTIDEIVGQCMLFISAGNHPVQSTLLSVIYQLATHPEVQEKLAEQVEEIWVNGNSSFLFEDVNYLESLDNVINETLRIAPPAVLVDRVCTKPFTIPGTDFIVEKGWMITIPIIGIQRDEAYFEDPEIFNPERFSVKNKDRIQSCSYLGFGEGPRHCLGKRLALVTMKVVLCHLLHKFQFETCKKTTIPMKYKDGNIMLPRMPDGEVWMKLRRRHSK